MSIIRTVDGVMCQYNIFNVCSSNVDKIMAGRLKRKWYKLEGKGTW